jgi:hypothetical protein
MGLGLDGAWETAAQIAIVVGVAYVLVLWVAAVVWVYRDISSRSRDPFSQVIGLVLVIFFSLPGLIIYLILRPKQTLADAYDRQLEAEALLHEIQEQATCPSCRRKVEGDFIACPFCRTTLRAPCENCGKALAMTWVLCPYCATARTPMVVASSRREPTTTPDEETVAIQRRARRPASTATYTPPAPAKPATGGDTAADA